jgi:uncharacterized protein with FMN-binding domain
MKSVVNRIVVALLLVTMTSVAAFAKSKKTNVTFTVDTKVSETRVKSGTYEAVFNEETGELSIVKGRKVVAKTATQLKMRDSKGRLTEIYTVKDSDQTARGLSHTSGSLRWAVAKELTLLRIHFGFCFGT